MNVYLSKLLMYYEIQRMSRDGHSISKISKYLGFNRRTVSKYLSMTEQEYEAFLISQSNRNKILSAYEDFVKKRLGAYGDTSAAQMHDWLKEHNPDFPRVNSKTVFNFVCYIREKYNIPRTKPERQFQSIEELPYGKQAQVDFGEYNMRSSTGSRVKVYFFALVLSRSRFKYIWFIDKPFTSLLAIQAHELAFAYIMGVPDEIVYDQDKVFLVSENNGDIILTDAFRSYMRDQNFDLYFCRKADPQSKGKVENVIKYVKQNFLYNRTFHNIETLNDEAMGWLGRTANALPHGFTKKEPHSEWIVEQPFLKSYSSYPVNVTPTDTYKVRKDNTILYKGNLYSLPLGTYQGKDTKVILGFEQGYMVITNEQGDQELCRHLVAVGGGNKVSNTDHKRDKTAAIDQMISQLSVRFVNQEKAGQWLAMIRKDKPRYIRDQIIAVGQAIEGVNADKVSQALDYCLENAIYNATDFKAVLTHNQKQEQEDTKVIPLNPLTGTTHSKAFNRPDTSAIEDYESIMKNNQKT